MRSQSEPGAAHRINRDPAARVRCAWPKRRRTRGVCTTCTATWPSGAAIGMAPVRAARRTVRRGACGWRLPSVSRRISFFAHSLPAFGQPRFVGAEFRQRSHGLSRRARRASKRKVAARRPAAAQRAKVSQTVPRIEPHPAPGPFFEGPKPFVRTAHGAAGPVFRRANHSPGLPECPNGDLLAVWFFSLSEVDLTTSNAASRLCFGAPEWEPAPAFWDAQDANALLGCQKMDLSPETRSSQQTQSGIGRNHRASRLNGVSGDQTVERIAVDVWKFARAIDEQFV